VSLFGIDGITYYHHHPPALDSTKIHAQIPNFAHGLGGNTVRKATPPPLKLTLHSPNGMQFFGEITIGEQTLSALYDTGSFDVITVSDLCGPCKVPRELKLYSNQTSMSFEKGDRSVKGHLFASGLLWAKQDFETIHIGPADSVISAERMPFWQVVHTDMRLWTRNRSFFSTYVGLGPGSIVPGIPKEEEQMKSLLEFIGTRRFAFCLKSDTGYLIFNPAYDLAAPWFASTFRSVPVIGKNHWAVELKSVSVYNNSRIKSACTNGQTCVVIIDSGTSLIGVPPKYFEFMNELSKQMKDDCSNLDIMPDLVFELGNQKFALPASAYVMRSSWDRKYCYPAFMDFAMPTDKGDAWILGVPFLRHFYTVFDRDGPSIHIAGQTESCEPLGSPPTGSGSFLHPSDFPSKKMEDLWPVVANITDASGPSWAHAEMKLIL